MTGPQVQCFLLDANINLQQANSQFTSFNTPQKQKSCSQCCGAVVVTDNKSGIRDSTSNAPPWALQLGTPPTGTKMLTTPSMKPIVTGRNGRIVAVTTISGSAATASVLATMCVITLKSIATNSTMPLLWGVRPPGDFPKVIAYGSRQSKLSY